MKNDELDFVGKRHRRSGAARRLGAMAAPAAAHGGAVVDDAAFLRHAEAVIDAFGQGDIDQGLTRAQIIERVTRTTDLDRDELDRRIDVFVELAMLVPYQDKAHQQRYVISTDSVAGHLFFRKGLTAGGIEELLQFLGATADAIESGRHDAGQVAAALTEQRGYVEMWTAAVNRLVDTATLDEMIAERAHHDGERMLAHVERLVGVVVGHHPSLRIAATSLSTSAQAYLMATQRLLERVVDEGAVTRDFSLLDPAQYTELALTGTVEDLASVFTDVVWDPPRPTVIPADVIEALRSYRPSHRRTRRPPVDEPEEGALPDPLEGLDRREELERQRQEHSAELVLQGEAAAELSAHLRAAPWPAAFRMIVEFAALNADARSRYSVELADTIVIDVDAHTTWSSDAALRADRAPGDDQVHIDPDTTDVGPRSCGTDRGEFDGGVES